MSNITRQFREAALRRGIIVQQNSSEPATALIQKAAAASLLQLGFIVDYSDLQEFSKNELANLVSDARTVSGAAKDMKPVYPGFPEQVKNTPVLQLISDQIRHYLTGGAYFPKVSNPERATLPIEDWFTSAKTVRVVKAGTVAKEYLQTVADSAIAISPDEQVLLKASVALVPDYDFISLIVSAKNQENMQRILSCAPGTPDSLLKAVLPNMSNPDAILRAVLATYTLPVKPEFEDQYQRAVYTLAEDADFSMSMVSMPRAVRVSLLRALGASTKGFKADALVSRREIWKHVMRMVHPFSLPPSKNSAVKRALDIVHENTSYVTLNGVLESYLEVGNVQGVVKVLSENSPQLLLTSLVRILRVASTKKDVTILADAVAQYGQYTTVRTLISAYNGVLSANETGVRVTRIAGRANSLTNRSNIVKISESSKGSVLEAIETALQDKLRKVTKAPKEPVGIISDVPVPLFKRDAATTDRAIFRGDRLIPAGDGDTLRLFSHWHNDGASSGYVDLAGVFLDSEFKTVKVVTWNSWASVNDVATYSGDTLVQPGHNAVEFIDIDVNKVTEHLPTVEWVAMTLISYSGPTLNDLDIYAGLMYRSDADKGEIFDPRTVVSASKPGVPSSQSVVLAVNIRTKETVWVDSSSGTERTGLSAASDLTIGPIVYDEIARPRMTLGKLALLWANAHKIATKAEPVDTAEVLNIV